MILKNESPKGKYFTIKVEGYPQRVWIDAYGQYDLSNISSKLAGDVVLNKPKRISSTGGSGGRSYIFLKGNNYSLFSNIDRGKMYYDKESRTLQESDFVSNPSSPTSPSSSITFTVNSLLDFMIENGIAGNTLSAWNTFFDTGTYATTPFTSLDGGGDTVILGGATELTIKNTLFQVNARGGTPPRLLSFVDTGSVTAIGISAFDNNTLLTTIDFPVVETIYSLAFTDCIALVNVGEFSNLTTFILDDFNFSNAFANCSALETISFPVATTLPSCIFSNGTGNSALISVSAPNITTIGNNVFEGCDVLESVNFPLVTYLGELAFRNCTILTDVVMPNVITAETRVFLGCSVNTEFDFPLLETIGMRAFDSCNSVETINLPSCTSMGLLIFNGIAGQTVTLTIPAALNADPSVTAFTAANTVTIINP